MVRSRKSSLLSEIGNKVNELEGKVNYISNFNYKKFELNDLKEELLYSEKKIFINMEEIGKSTFEIAEELYKVNKILANHNGGTYMAWCESLGINKDKSSVLLKKYNLYLETNRKKAMELPIKVIKVLTKKDNPFSTDEILTIVESKKPNKKLEEIKSQYSHYANTGLYRDIEEAEIIENIEDEKKKLKERKREYLKQNREIREEIDKKKNQIEKNLNEINNIENILKML